MINDNHKLTFFNEQNPYLNKLTDDDREQMEGEITEQECLSTLKNMSNGKSPGIDGFTVEFYKFFWSDIKFHLIRSFRYSYDNQSMSVSQRQSIITCLPKEGKQKTLLRNWRPISLLNVDYKLASACIANRIKTHLDKIISETQLGFVKDRYIGECSRLICDLIDKTEEENIPGILLLLDFEKAFDSLEWNFIKETLSFFNFGPCIMQWFTTLYHDITSSIQNNGHLSPFFGIKRGVRQGDPLSPYLFILCLELLSAAIKFDPEIKGITINDTEYLLSHYADDSVVLLKDDEHSLNKTLDIIELFADCSGLRANFDKTEAVWIGAKRGRGEELHTNKTISWNHTGNFKLLGIKYEMNNDNHYKINFTDKIAKLKKLLEDWYFRNLSIMGKVTVVKTLALPILVHIFTVLPNPPDCVFKDIDTVIYRFIWNGKIDKIKRSVLITIYENGGLKVPNAKLFAESLKLTWLKKVFDVNNSNPWKILLIDEIEPYGGEKFWSLTKEGLKTKSFSNPFWQNILEIWSNIQQNPATTPEEILSQPI